MSEKPMFTDGRINVHRRKNQFSQMEEPTFTNGRTAKTASVSDGESDSGISSQNDSRHEFPPELEYGLDCSPRPVHLPDWANQRRLPSCSLAVLEHNDHCKDYDHVLKRKLVDEGNSSFTTGDVTNLESTDSGHTSRSIAKKTSSDGHLCSENENREVIDTEIKKQSTRNDVIIKYVNPIYDQEDNDDDDDCFAIDLRQGHYCCGLSASEVYTKEKYVDNFSNKHGCEDKSQELRCSLEREENSTEIHCSWKSGSPMDEQPIDYSQLSSRWKDTSEGDRNAALLHPGGERPERRAELTAECLPEATANKSTTATRSPVLATNVDVMLSPKINGLPKAAANISRTKVRWPPLAMNVERKLSPQNNDFPKAEVNISKTITGSPVLATNVEFVLSPKTIEIPSSRQRAGLFRKASGSSDQTSSHAFVAQSSSKLENCGCPCSALAAPGVSPHTYIAKETNKYGIVVGKCKSPICNPAAGFNKPNMYHPKLKYLATVSRLQTNDLQEGRECVPSPADETVGYRPFCDNETVAPHDMNHHTGLGVRLNSCNTDSVSKTDSSNTIHNIADTAIIPALDYGAERGTVDLDQMSIISAPRRRISILHSLNRLPNKSPNPEYSNKGAVNASKQFPAPNSLPQNNLACEEKQTFADTKSGLEKHACADCSKWYSTASNLARHRQIHTHVCDERARTCPYCENMYLSTAAYAMHARTHILGSGCPFCGKHFSRPWLLQGHIRTHTGEKPFPCPQCGKRFADKSNLRAHIQTHATDKPHVCRRCRKAFALRSYLCKHESSSCIKNPGLGVTV